MHWFGILTAVLLLVPGKPARAQQADQLIVPLRPGTPVETWATAQAGVSARVLNHRMGLVLLTVDTERTTLAGTYRRYRHAPAVAQLQYNHRLSLRSVPNDPLYGRQWQLNNTGQNGGPTGADYGVPSAWAYTTGGVTANGDTIVIASIDSGIDLDHEDLVPNHWINRDEIPGNDIDDDNNGYVDDRYGWNTALDNPDVEAGGGAHGTPVMGQLGARGNNGTGVAGMNWRVRVMHITNDFNPLESEVMEAYGYVLDARRRYAATGGREGAYVVATNSSWGRDFARPEDSPIWCALYDSLGRAGILNVAAVPNRDRDVDAVGDLPTLCPSEYLLTVTNLLENDQRSPTAAYGPASVDLAAYGTDVFTTLAENGYGAVNGTSFATPAVTGAAALLFSAPCATFGRLLRDDPAGAARYVRDLLLHTGRPVQDLAGSTRSGRALDVGAAMGEMMRGCEDPVSTHDVRAGSPVSVYPNPTGDRAFVSWPPYLDVRSLTVYSVTGRRMLERIMPAGQSRSILPTHDWPPGTYFLLLRDRQGRVFHGKVVRL
jgi:subtilisin family serine protease